MKYKNKSNKELWLPGIGKVKPEGIIDQPDGFNNANFEKVEEAKLPKATEEESREYPRKRFKAKEK